MKAQDMSIQYGVTHVSKDGPNVARISEMFIHPKFDEENTYFADIALLKVLLCGFIYHKYNKNE